MISREAGVESVGQSVEFDVRNNSKAARRLSLWLVQVRSLFEIRLAEYPVMYMVPYVELITRVLRASCA